MSTRDRNMLVGIALLLILGAFWMLALAPRRAASADLASQVAAAQQQRDDAAAQSAIARTAQENFKADYAVVAKLGKAVPAQDDTASLLYQLQDVAGRSRVEMRSIAPAGANGAPAGNAAAAGAAAPGTVPGPAGATAVSLSLSFAGSYRDLQRFVQRVQNFTSIKGDRIRVSGRLLSIDGIKLATEPLTRRISAEITATAYIAAPPVAATTTPVAGADPAVPAPQTAAVPAPTPAAVVAGG